MPTLVCFGREEEPIDMLLVICLKGKQNPLIIILSLGKRFLRKPKLSLAYQFKLLNKFLTARFFTTMIRSIASRTQGL
ncbi:MAG: hypothetical protein RL553_620 [Planctomycetota bacterium]|jgi:hypothetical protein